MANANQAVSFDDIIQEGRKKRHAEKLAQEIFGKGRRSSAPPSGPKAGLGGSLASRVGVNKRNSSLPRSETPRQQRPAGRLSRPPTNDNYRSRPSYTQPVSDPVSEAKSNGYARDADVANGGGGLNIKGAASGPYIVVAQNFAPGTTAADIESVMLSVGGQMTSCKLVASNPTVIAEMAFVEKAGAEKVIETFNNKKADGRPLYVYWRTGGAPPPSRVNTNNAPPRRQQQPEPQTRALGAPAETEDVAMEVDENASAREAQDRLREERRGGDDRAAQRDVFPSGPRNYRSEMDSYYGRRPSERPESGYQDGRFGFGGGGGGGGGYRDGGGRGRGRYDRDERRFGGGQSWRP